MTAKTAEHERKEEKEEGTLPEKKKTIEDDKGQEDTTKTKTKTRRRRKEEESFYGS